MVVRGRFPKKGIPTKKEPKKAPRLQKVASSCWEVPGAGDAFPLLPNTPGCFFFGWYDVGPLLNEEVFTIEAQVVEKIPTRKSGYLEPAVSFCTFSTFQLTATT